MLSLVLGDQLLLLLSLQVQLHSGLFPDFQDCFLVPSLPLGQVHFQLGTRGGSGDGTVGQWENGKMGWDYGKMGAKMGKWGGIMGQWIMGWHGTMGWDGIMGKWDSGMGSWDGDGIMG